MIPPRASVPAVSLSPELPQLEVHDSNHFGEPALLLCLDEVKSNVECVYEVPRITNPLPPLDPLDLSS